MYFLARLQRMKHLTAVQNWEIFAVDSRDLGCYKPLKDKLFGGESPVGTTERSTRVRLQTCLAGQAC